MPTITTHAAVATTAKGIVDLVQMPTLTPKPWRGRRQSWLCRDRSARRVYERRRTLRLRVPDRPRALCSGTVAAVGEGVSSVAVGDRVAAFCMPNYGSGAKGAQEHAVLPQNAVGKIPDGISLPDACTLPDNIVCAYWTLVDSLKLPLEPKKEKQSFADSSFLIYGDGTTAAQYMIQLLHMAGCRNVIAAASPAHHDYLRNIGATTVLDYRAPDFVEQITRAAGGGAVQYAMDPIATEKSLAQIMVKVVDRGSKVAALQPIKVGGQDGLVGGSGTSHFVYELPESVKFPAGVEVELTRTFTYESNEYLKNNLKSKILPKLLVEGVIQPSRKHLIDDSAVGLKDRVVAALQLYQENKVSGVKVIVKVQDIE